MTVEPMSSKLTLILAPNTKLTEIQEGQLPNSVRNFCPEFSDGGTTTHTASISIGLRVIGEGLSRPDSKFKCP